MKIKKIIFTIICGLQVLSLQAQNENDIPIGQWRDHFSYYFTHAICKVEDRILVAGESALFYYDPKTKHMDKMTKGMGLSDAGICVVEYDSISQSIVITYDNSNIDIVQNNIVYNIPDIKNRSIEGSKVIKSIYFNNNKAYLSCGFGVVVLDLIRHEIFDTWYLGDNSSAINVNCIYINDTSIFAGTKQGLKYADKKSNALAASDTWHNQDIGDSNHIEVNYICKINSREILVSFIDEAIRLENPQKIISCIKRFDGENVSIFNEQIYLVKMRQVNDKIAMIDYLGCSMYDSTMTQILHYSDSWNPLPGISLDVKDVWFDNKDVWFSHRYVGLVHVPIKDNGTYEREILYPDGPKTNNVYSLTVTPKGTVYVAPGGKDAMGNNRGVEGDCYIYNGYYWHDLDYGKYSKDTLIDFLKVTVDPRDEKHIMVSTWWDGIIEAYNDTIINIFDSSNTDNMLDKFSYNYRIAGIDYDVDANLLIANSYVNHALTYLNYQNKWGNFLTTSFINGNEIRGMCVDNMFFYKLLYTTDNKIIMINNNGEMRYIDPNKGSQLETSNINCMVQDLDGEIWIGTEKGIKVIYSLYDAMSNSSSTASNVECNNIVYTEYNSQDTISQYLLSFENITCIMVDGANRKWIGTERNGIYVLNSSGSKEICHFTLENSPLVSNKIICMAQNYNTGEVFIGTDRGLVSYRAQSMPEAQEMKNLTVYPNPVRPGYDGVIAIKGFLNDTDVRITDINGRMVAHLQSLGGQAIWDGRNFKGQKVGSGVYFIFASADEGQHKADGKLLIIR